MGTPATVRGLWSVRPVSTRSSDSSNLQPKPTGANQVQDLQGVVNGHPTPKGLFMDILSMVLGIVQKARVCSPVRWENKHIKSQEPQLHATSCNTKWTYEFQSLNPPSMNDVE